MKNNRRFLISIFILLSMVQCFFIAHRIYQNNRVLKKGKVFLFELKQKDPRDIFRGKYMELNYKNDTISLKNFDGLQVGQKIWVKIRKNKEGYAFIDSLYMVPPQDLTQIIPVKITNINIIGKKKIIQVKFPFDKFYINEFKMNKLQQVPVTNSPVSASYAKVRIWKGRGIVQELIINGKHIGK